MKPRLVHVQDRMNGYFVLTVEWTPNLFRWLLGSRKYTARYLGSGGTVWSNFGADDCLHGRCATSVETMLCMLWMRFKHTPEKCFQ